MCSVFVVQLTNCVYVYTCVDTVKRWEPGHSRYIQDGTVELRTETEEINSTVE